ncbi:C-C motif chemokine 4-like [Salarias fasciatus]|uniref:C-C motif chemokine 4-like n=1 Tax=Salarias fasciatus TaxID=181472 RepID=UPI001176590A|nr:C-C motif chemokine 4-like [Salarias fasciatus]
MKPEVTSGLLLLLLLSSCSAGPDLDIFSSCCPNVSKIRVPREKIVSVTATPGTCRPAAIIVETKRGKKMCLEPDSAWAKNLLKEFSRPSGFLNATSKPSEGLSKILRSLNATSKPEHLIKTL